MTHPTPAPLAVSLADAARMLAVSRRTAEHLVATGQLPSRRLGRRRIVRVADLHRLLARDTPSIAPRPTAPAADAEAQ